MTSSEYSDLNSSPHLFSPGLLFFSLCAATVALFSGCHDEVAVVSDNAWQWGRVAPESSGHLTSHR